MLIFACFISIPTCLIQQLYTKMLQEDYSEILSAQLDLWCWQVSPTKEKADAMKHTTV